MQRRTSLRGLRGLCHVIQDAGSISSLRSGKCKTNWVQRNFGAHALVQLPPTVAKVHTLHEFSWGSLCQADLLEWDVLQSSTRK
mmetsp:Transcript_27238/g.57220  ORF Transcript_27238/g.57220 Transcript_27238/m.57220 type:complete len:84 (+) Transcript_27238:907-1158(+)